MCDQAAPMKNLTQRKSLGDGILLPLPWQAGRQANRPVEDQNKHVKTKQAMPAMPSPGSMASTYSPVFFFLATLHHTMSPCAFSPGHHAHMPAAH